MEETASQRAVRIAKLKSDLAQVDKEFPEEKPASYMSNSPWQLSRQAPVKGLNDQATASHESIFGPAIANAKWLAEQSTSARSPNPYLAGVTPPAAHAEPAAPAAPIEPPHGFHGNAVDTLPIFAQKSVNNQPGAGVSGMNLLSDAQQATSAANPQFNLNPNAYQGNASTQWSSPVAQLAPSVAPALAVARQATAAPAAAPQAAPAQTPATAPAPQAAAPDARQETPESLWETYNQSNSPADFLRASNASQGNFAHGGSVPDDHPIVQRAMHLVRNFLMNG